MDISSVGTSAVSSAMNSDSNVKQTLAIAALKADEQSQAAILQLFNTSPSADSGRGQNVDVSA
jgi:hypothetical protein